MRARSPDRGRFSRRFAACCAKSKPPSDSRSTFTRTGRRRRCSRSCAITSALPKCSSSRTASPTSTTRVRRARWCRCRPAAWSRRWSPSCAPAPARGSRTAAAPRIGGGRRSRPGARPARGSQLLAAARVAQRRGRARLLLRICERRALAAVPPGLRAPGLSRSPTGSSIRPSIESSPTSWPQSPRSKDPVILVQDYHFALLPRLLRERKPAATIALFWHIPWPNAETFGVCPWKQQILTHMLAADILGFHTRYHCQNFLATVDRFLECQIDHEHMTVTLGGRVCRVVPYPISIEWPPRWLATLPDIKTSRESVRARHGIGAQRMPRTRRRALGFHQGHRRAFSRARGAARQGSRRARQDHAAAGGRADAQQTARLSGPCRRRH